MRPSLTKLGLFKDMSLADISRLLDSCRHTVKTYSKGEVMALKGSRYHSLMIISHGSITSETTDRDGNITTIDVLRSPVLIAPRHLFAEDDRLPVNITARSAVQAIIISREDLYSLLRKDARVLRNFLEIVSTPGRFVSESVVYVTYKTIKSKFANYLLDRMGKHGNNRFRNEMTQREMAELFGVTRPALARAIGELAGEDAIFVKGKDIEILSVEKLREYAKQ